MTRSVGLHPPSGRGGVLVVLAALVAVAVVCLAAPRGCDAEVIAAARRVALGCALGTVATVYLLSRRVSAEATGLRVHGLLGQRSIPWTAVLHAQYVPERRRIEILTAAGVTRLPADPELGERIGEAVPGRSSGLSDLPPARAQRQEATARGLESWLVALQTGALAVLVSSVVPSLEVRLAAGGVLILLGAGWLVTLRREPRLLRSLAAPDRAAPGPVSRVLASTGETAAAAVLLVVLINVVLGFAARATTPPGSMDVPVLAAAALPVRPFSVRGRELSLPASMATGCGEKEGGLTCMRSDGWIIVDREESGEGLLGGRFLGGSVRFRRDDLRLDALPHEALTWYVAGTLAHSLGSRPPQGLLLRDDGEAAVFWRRAGKVQALVTSGGEMLSVDVRGRAGEDATLLPLLASITASGSDLTCRWAQAAIDVARGR